MKKYLDPSILSRLQGLEFKARLVVEGNISGMHKSPYKGFSVEFAEHKSYFPGDDIRYIDWKLYGRTDKFFIKQFEEDTNLRSYIVVDTSLSMGYGNPDETKLDYAGFLAVALGYLMLTQRDSVGLLTFNRTIVNFTPPRSGLAHLQYLMNSLESAQPSSQTKICHALQYLASRIKRRALIILISDLIDTQREVLNHLKYLRRMKHELIVLHLIHPDEIELPFHGTVRFKNCERPGELFASPDRIRKSYQARLFEYIDTYQHMCWENDIGYFRISTDVPVETSVLNIISRRKKR